MSRFRETIDSRARATNERWAFNRKRKICACGEESKEIHQPVGKKCWFAAPQELRDAWQQAVRSKDAQLAHKAAVKLVEFAKGRAGRSAPAGNISTSGAHGVTRPTTEESR